jgi:hypothetical protein
MLTSTAKASRFLSPPDKAVDVNGSPIIDCWQLLKPNWYGDTNHNIMRCYEYQRDDDQCILLRPTNKSTCSVAQQHV